MPTKVLSAPLEPRDLGMVVRPGHRWVPEQQPSPPLTAGTGSLHKALAAGSGAIRKTAGCLGLEPLGSALTAASPMFFDIVMFCSEGMCGRRVVARASLVRSVSPLSDGGIGLAVF